MEIDNVTKEAEQVFDDRFSEESYSSHKQSFLCGFAEGVEFAQKELSEWHLPDEPPESFVDVLLKVRKDYGGISYEIGIYRCRTHIYPGKIHYYQYHDMNINDEVIGWKPII